MNACDMISVKLINKGIYPLGQAAKLASLATEHRVDAQSLRRWLWGYPYRVAGGTAKAPPLWLPELPELQDGRALSFKDLIEVMFVAAFRQHGISLQTIRRLIDRAVEHIADSRPLSAPAFRTDGKRILAEVVTEDEKRLCFDLDSGQYLLELVFDRLRSVIDYSDLLTAARWWPLGRQRRIVVDPARSFGEAIECEYGIPTVVLKDVFEAEGNLDAVSYWFGVSRDAAEDAVAYECRLAAA